MPYDPVHPENSGVLYDESGKPYVLQADGKGGYTRNYVSPVAMGGQAPADNTSIFRSAPQWNTGTGQWDTPIDWGNILTLGTAGALTGGALDALGVFGGAAAGGGGAAASQSVPAATGAGAAAADAALPSATIGTGMLGPIAGGTGTDVAGMLAGGASAGGNALAGLAGGSGFSSSDLLKLLGVGGLTGLGLAQNNHQSMPPELEQILALQRDRLQKQTPLYDSILKLSQSRLPVSARS